MTNWKKIALQGLLGRKKSTQSGVIAIPDRTRPPAMSFAHLFDLRRVLFSFCGGPIAHMGEWWYSHGCQEQCFSEEAAPAAKMDGIVVYE